LSFLPERLSIWGVKKIAVPNERSYRIAEETMLYDRVNVEIAGGLVRLHPLFRVAAENILQRFAAPGLDMRPIEVVLKSDIPGDFPYFPRQFDQAGSVQDGLEME
jgi:hypothetical protein